MPQPAEVRVNGRVYKFRYKAPSRMPEALGLFHADASLIDIRNGQSPVEKRDTILHETLHALLYAQGRENGGDVEEMYVRAIATGLLGIFQDNPEFTKWLTQPNPTT